MRFPSQGGSLVDRLADNKRYLEDLDRVLLHQQVEASSSDHRFSTHDTGHEMVSYRLVNNSAWATVTSPYPGSVGRMPICVQQVGHPSWVPNTAPDRLITDSTNHAGASTFIPKNWDKGSPFGLQADHQGVVNRLFSSTIPDNPTAQLGETIISFIRGDYPKIWTNLIDFQKRVAKAGGAEKVKKVAQGAGGEYLHVVFGWIPTVGDLVNAIRVLVDVSDLVYSASDRRHRSWPGSTSISRTGVSPFFSSGMFVVGDRDKSLGGGLPTPYPTDPKVQWEAEITASTDYKFSARYGNLARPTVAQKDFLTRAEQTVHDLGLVYDTLIWDLTPFSWLFDWFVSLGSSISNAAAFGQRYNVDYAYVTTQYSVTTDIRVPMRTWSADTGGVTKVRINGNPWGTSIVRHRQRATPFGFGTSLGGLNASQMAILVALGLANVR